MKIGVGPIWIEAKPFKKWAERRARKRAEKTGQAVPVETEEVSMNGFKTYTGIAAAALGVVLGWLGVGDTESAALSAQIVAALNELLTVGGLLFAAYGRAKAKPAA